jgi:3'-phosphoadenosine 5'-phosphosulfate sulfotransferase (PAPS reductase)/FAD synthetase
MSDKEYQTLRTLIKLNYIIEIKQSNKLVTVDEVLLTFSDYVLIKLRDNNISKRTIELTIHPKTDKLHLFTPLLNELDNAIDSFNRLPNKKELLVKYNVDTPNELTLTRLLESIGGNKFYPLVVKDDWDLYLKIAESLLIIALAKKKSELNNLEMIVSNSGGVDSTVVSYLTRILYPNIKEVFFNTGIEHKGNIKYLKSIKHANFEWRTPKKSMKQICYEDGFPIGSKENVRTITDLQMLDKRLKTNFKNLTGYTNFGLNNTIGDGYKTMFKAPIHLFNIIHLPLTISCCSTLKKKLNDKSEYPLIGYLKNESKLRDNTIKSKGFVINTKAYPIAKWTKSDVWKLIMKYNISYAKSYDEMDRTGCLNCLTRINFLLKNNKSAIDGLKENGLKNKQLKAHLNYKHKSGMTYEDVIKEYEKAHYSKDYKNAYEIKLNLLYRLRDIMNKQNIEYNNDILEHEINLVKSHIKRLTKH